VKKLTDKLKYKIADGHAELYAKRKDTGAWALMATCHLSALDHIVKHGMKATIDLGCIRWSPQ
jgi:hypothetical protein